jgi:rare lipoprotein A
MLHRALLFALALLLAGCATRSPTPLPDPGPAPRGGRDGLPLDVPPDLLRVPDAVPRIEPIRAGGPNKPYEVAGQRFEPLLEDLPYREKGIASWYGKKFHGRQTASGETYNMYAMSAAHPRWPLPSYARVRNPANGREVIVRINDRGPFVRGRVIDLSYTAALKLDLHRGVAPVEIQRLTFDEIRSGGWRREPDDPVLAAPAPAVGEPAQPSTGTLRTPIPPAASPSDDQARAASKGLWVQIGAFRVLESAVALKEQVTEEWAEAAPLVTTFRDRGLHRVQVGPFSSAESAQAAADRLGGMLGLKPVLVRR